MNAAIPALLGDAARARATCPTCSPTRRKQAERCLRLWRADGAIHWRCKHCNERGSTETDISAAFLAPFARTVTHA